MPRLDRLLAIALHLGSRRRLVARELADRFGVSLRTIYRDVSALVAAGFPVEGTAGDGYRLVQDGYLRPLALAPDEAEAIAIAAHGYGATVPPSLKESLARATIKIEAVLDRATRDRVRELERRIVVPGFARVIGPDADVLAALHARRSARIRYAPAGARATTRTIEPLGLVCRGDAWWLLAYCRLRRDARAFRLDAIADWRAGPPFAARPGFTFADVVARDRHLAERLFGY